MALLAPHPARRGLLSAGELNALPDGAEVAACGIVTVRQQPQTAKGTVFVTLEDLTPLLGRLGTSSRDFH